MRPLAVALLTHDYTLKRWEIDALQRLESAGAVAVAALIALGPRPRTLERAWLGAQQALEGRDPDPLADSLDARAAFPLAAAATAAAREDPIDVIVACGVDPSARGGRDTIGLSFGGAADDIGLFRAYMHGMPLDLAVTLGSERGERVLASARPAFPERGLLSEVQQNVLRRASALLEKALRELADDLPPIAASAGATAPPVTLAAACRNGSRKAGRVMQRALRRLRQGAGDPDDNWFLAYRTNSDAFVCNSERFRADGYRLILPPPGRFYADPCVIEHEGEDHVFFEEWRPDLARGVISWMRRDGDRFTPPEPVLERPYHLSYPFVFRAGGDIFMVPETGHANRIEMYRAVEFPQRWEPAQILVDGIAAADATVLEADGGWWMFAVVGEAGVPKCDQLWIFHADAVGGPWRPHVRNPVKIDVRSARPAGSLFRRGGKLIRPTQDCSATYGGALTLCEVTRLTRRDYAEVEVETLLPGWLPSNLGFHTVSSSRGLEVIDGKMPSGKESRFPALEGALYIEAPA
ncbi:MAG TPA: hypothetical protein VFB01_08445 [Burkholderiales bacterium]|nr:hypothetical protein [Burkholderiales bacterium]